MKSGRKFILLTLVLSLIIFLSVKVDKIRCQQEITEIGEPVRNQIIDKDEEHSFTVKVSTFGSLSNAEFIAFMATPYSGDIDMVVATYENPTKDCTGACWKSTSPHGELITIQRNDLKWPSDDGTFYIKVFAVTGSTYSFNTYKSKAIIHSYNREPQVSKVQRNDLTYFRFNLDEQLRGRNFTISANPISGDPDIFVSTTSERPSKSDYQWKSRNWGFDTIHIESGDEHYVETGNYYIAVEAFTDTFFTLTVTEDTSYELILEAVPLTSFVDKKQYKYYQFSLQENAGSLIFNINPLSSQGDPDLYIKYNAADPKPSKTNYDYRSSGLGDDKVTIPDAQKGQYYVAVYGYHETRFQLYATSEVKSALLYDGVTYGGSKTSQTYAYYKFYHGDKDSSITITATGDNIVDLYVSLLNSKPTKEPGKYEYVGTHIGKNTYVFQNAPVVEGTYYIGLYSEENTNFTITAKTNQTATVLRNGQVSFWNHVPDGYYRYFIFDNEEASEDVTITVTPYRGEVDLYASTVIERPTKESNQSEIWASETWKQDTIAVSSTDEKLFGKNRFYIGVYGRRDSYFSITTYLSNTTVEITDGEPINGIVPARTYRYFKFFVTHSGSCTVNMELYDAGSTEADIYASSTNPKPNMFDYTYKSTKYGNDFLNVKYAQEGFLYIAVYGLVGEQISFTLTATLEYQYLIQNRQSLIQISPKGSVKKFQSYVWAASRFLLASVTLISGRTNLYIENKDGVIASPTNYTWSSTEWPGNTILIPSTDPNFKERTYYSLAVEAVDNSDYYISILQAGSGAWLSIGSPRLVKVTPNEHLMFMFRIPYEPNEEKVNIDYQVNLRVIQQSVNVYVGQDWRNYPTPQNHTFKSEGPKNRILVLSKEQLTQGYVFVSCYAPVESQSVFEISITQADTPRYLTQDQPQLLDAPPKGTYSYFRVLNSQVKPSGLIFIIDSCSDIPPPKAYGSYNELNPGPKSSYDFNSKGIEKYRGEINVKYDESKNSKVYYIGIESNGNSYSVFPTINDQTRPGIKSRFLYSASNKKQSGAVTVKVPAATAPPRFTDLKQFSYTAYLMEVSIKSGRPEELNFHTVCSIEQRGRYIATVYGKVGEDIEIIVPVKDDKKTYLVNVVVRDDFGVSSSYAPSYIIDGKVYPEYPFALNFPFSIGLLFLLVASVAFVSYIFIGITVNVVRRKKGLEVIPNVEFWMKLPGLVVDGVKFIVSCGKRQGKYSTFNDDDVNAYDEEVEKESSHENQSLGGYGAL